MWVDRLCHTGPENSGDEALARRLLGRGGPRLRANLRHDLRYAYGTRLCALRRRHPIHEFLAVPEPKRSNVCASTREPARAGGPEALPRSGRRRRKPRPVRGRGEGPYRPPYAAIVERYSTPFSVTRTGMRFPALTFATTDSGISIKRSARGFGWAIVLKETVLTGARAPEISGIRRRMRAPGD